MRKAIAWFTVCAMITGMGTIAHAQEVKKGGRAPASAAYRTLSGKISEIDAGEMMVTLELAADSAAAKPKTKAKEKEKEKARAKDKAAGGRSWVLSLGRQTLLLRAGKNNQFATIEFGDLQKGESVQAVVSLQAGPDDRSHTAWWLVVYPAGTTPPSR